MRSAALEQRHRFVKLALAPPQLPEADQPLARHGGPRRGELAGCRGQLPLGFRPRAAPHAHRRVLGPAHGEQRPESPALAEGLETIAPLHRPLVVADALAGGNQVAAGEADHRAIAHLAGEHGGVDAVELAKAFRDMTRGHARKAVQRASDHFVVDRAERLANPHGLGGKRLSRVRIAIVEQREDPASQRQPRMFGRVGMAVQDPAGLLEPSVGDRLFTAERGGVPGEPDRHPRRAEAVVALSIDAIGALPDVEHHVGQIEPPGGEAEAFERLGVLFDAQMRFERDVRRWPVAAAKRRPAGIEMVGGGDH